MTVQIDSLTWTCMVCGDWRNDSEISVAHQKARGFEDYEGARANVRYCNDRLACTTVAHTVTVWPRRQVVLQGEYELAVTAAAIADRVWHTRDMGAPANWVLDQLRAGPARLDALVEARRFGSPDVFDAVRELVSAGLAEVVR